LTIDFSYKKFSEQQLPVKDVIKNFFAVQWLLNVPLLYLSIIILYFFYKAISWLDDDDWLKYDSLSLIVISRNPPGTYPNDWWCVCFAGVGLFARGCHGRQTLYPRSGVAIVNYQSLGRDFCVLMQGGDRNTGTCSTAGIKCLTSGSTCTYIYTLSFPLNPLTLAVAEFAIRIGYITGNASRARTKATTFSVCLYSACMYMNDCNNSYIIQHIILLSQQTRRLPTQISERRLSVSRSHIII